jgi:predicted Fe-S protein YdhL (DUF1289 family)
MIEPEPVASPCTKVCKIDEATGWCLGCQRTLAEIAAWGTLDDDAKRDVLARLPARRAAQPTADPNSTGDRR